MALPPCQDDGWLAWLAREFKALSEKIVDVESEVVSVRARVASGLNTDPRFSADAEVNHPDLPQPFWIVQSICDRDVAVNKLEIEIEQLKRQQAKDQAEIHNLRKRIAEFESVQPGMTTLMGHHKHLSNLVF